VEYPSHTPRWRRYLRFWWRDVHADIEDELHFHFETRIDELVAQGLARHAATKQALEEFGDVSDVRQGLRAIDGRIARRERRGEWLAGWRQDVTYAFRSLRRTPGVTITIIVTLALGLGVNTAMFSLLNAVFLRPPSGVAQPEQVRRLWSEMTFQTGKQFWSGYAYPQYLAVGEALGTLGRMTMYRGPEEVRVGRGPGASHAMRSSAKSDYFAVLGVRPALGRFFTPDEDRMGAGERVAVVSHGFWQRALGGDPRALGQPILLEGQPHVVIGVADPAFTGVDLDATDVWTPVAAMTWWQPSWWTGTNVNGFQILIRPADGVRVEAIDARVTMALRQDRGGRWASVSRTGSIIAAQGPGKKLQEVEIATRLGGVALIVLFIACANVVNLLLARAVRRRREIAVRLSLGISRSRLARLLLTESLLLALGAGAAAILAAQWGGTVLRTLLLPDVRWAHSPIDWRVLIVAAVATLIAGLIAGAIPALQAGSTALNEVLKTGAREGHIQRSRTRSLLVVAQAALSVMLLVGAALFVRSLANVRGLDLGFDASRLLFARVRFEAKDSLRDAAMPTRLAELAERLRGAPGVQETALTGMPPMRGFSTQAYYPDADTLTHKKPMGMFWAVSSGYFETAGTRLVSGSRFPRATGSAMPPSVIVNDAMAKALWPNENPIGRCVRFAKPDARCNTVIGVVETAHWDGLIEEPTPQFYLPVENMPFTGWRANVIALRANERDVAGLTRQVSATLRGAFPDGEIVIDAMSTILEPKFRPWRLGATLFSMFGILAAIVAAVGIYSTVSYSVSQRTHEFGVRVALGAQLADVVRQVMAEGLRTVVVGVAIGVVLALAAGRLIASLLYGISPRDPAAISVVVVTLLAVAAAAAMVPAWRAARVDPVTALRAE